MNEITTPEQFRCEMQKIRHDVGDNKDVAHDRMDSVLCRVLVELGYRDGVEIFKTQGKWYA